MRRETLKAKEDARLSGRAEAPEAKVPSYQELLDLALDDTFPASDPLAIGAAEHVQEPRTTAADALDWTLQPGAAVPPGQKLDHDKAGREVAAECDATVVEALLCEVDAAAGAAGDRSTIDIPAGPCRITQSAEFAVVRWRGGAAGAVEMQVDLFRQLLADGLIVRAESC